MTDNKRFAIYGATGYTGRQVASEVAWRGLVPVLIGRDRAKLEAVADGIADSEVRVADLDDSAALRASLDESAAVINCAGPFSTTAVAVIAAAMDAGCHYVDCTAEQEAVVDAFERWDVPAREQGLAVVPAMGYFGALGDLLVTVTAEGVEKIEQVTVAHAIENWRPTTGSLATAHEMAAERHAWRGNQLELVEGDPRFSSFEYPAPLGQAQVLEDYPLPEAVVVPRHLETPEVRALMTASTVQEVFSTDATMASAISDADRAASRFVIVAVVGDGTNEHRSTLKGADIYGITAPIVVEAAVRLAHSDRFGAVAPGEAFRPREFLACLEARGLELEMNPAQEVAL